jgi:hypothetical protein
MPISLPASPALNDTYTYGSKTWKWDGTKWNTQPDYSNSPTGPTGPNSIINIKSIYINGGTDIKSSTYSSLPSNTYLVVKDKSNISISTLDYVSNLNSNIITTTTSSSVILSSNVSYMEHKPLIITDSTYNGTAYVLFSDFGSILTSTDMLTWNFFQVPLSNIGINSSSRIVKAVYTGSKYLLTDETNGLYVSTDLVQWSKVNLPFSTSSFQPSVIGHGNGIYVIGGTNNNLLTSTDTITWTSRTSGFSSNFSITSYAYGNNTHVIGAESVVATSTNAVTWTSRATQFGTPTIARILYANSLFLASGTSGSCNTSTDGITWVSRTTGLITSLTNSEYGNGLYLLGGLSSELATSTDTITWTTRTHNLFHNAIMRSITYLPSLSKYVIMNMYLESSSSTDGATWVGNTLGTFSTYTTGVPQIIYGNGKYVTHDGTGVIKYSNDGNIWFNTGLLGNAVYSGAFGNNTYVLAGFGGAIKTSTDAITWTTRTSPTSTTTIYSLYYINSIFILYGSFSGSQIYTSTDAITWTGRAGVITSSVGAVGLLSYNSKIYSFAATNEIKNSTDGITWTNVGWTFPNSSYATSSAHNNNKIIVVALDQGNVFTSQDGGITWGEYSTPLTSQASALICVNGLFIMSYPNSVPVCSVDGINWSFITTSIYFTNKNNIEYLNNKIFAFSMPGGTFQTNINMPQNNNVQLLPYSASSIITAT